MKKRCLNINTTHYASYGGRGISVCARWLVSFADFLEDMGERPEGTSLDRIDNNGNYEPGNCRWSTPLEQGMNKRNNKLLTVKEKMQTLGAWARELRISRQTLSRKIKAHGSLENFIQQELGDEHSQLLPFT